MFHVPESARIKNHHLDYVNSDISYGNNGMFNIKLSNQVVAWIIASDGAGWEHVSVHMTDGKITKGNGERTPTWSEMCKIKDIFWDGEDCVVQYHPPKSTYINNHAFTLHLWKPISIIIPMPESILVGLQHSVG